MQDVLDFFSTTEHYLKRGYGIVIFSEREDEHWSPEDAFFHGEPYPDPAYLYPQKHRDASVVVCPECQSPRKTKALGYQRVKCHACGVTFRAFVGTEEKRLNDLTIEDNESELIIL